MSGSVRRRLIVAVAVVGTLAVSACSGAASAGSGTSGRINLTMWFWVAEQVLPVGDV
jgi:ABC-type glycerol-3-phosphate transport system substrate-binding protein